MFIGDAALPCLFIGYLYSWKANKAKTAEANRTNANRYYAGIVTRSMRSAEQRKASLGDLRYIS